MSKEVKRYTLYPQLKPEALAFLPDVVVDAKAYDALLAERVLLRDALNHIASTARASRTQTRRLRWIEQRASWALSGREYSDDAFDLPKDMEEKNFALRVQRNQFRDRVAVLEREAALWEPLHQEIHRRAEKQWCLSSQCDFEVTVTYEDYAAIDAGMAGGRDD